MKETYENVKMEVTEFAAEDVILTSTPDPNEGPMNGDF